MIVPLILAGIRGGLALASAAVDVYGAAQKLWRGQGPLPGAQGESQPLPSKDVEHQREQMRAATSKGTVTGPTTSPRAPAPDTVRSFPVRPPPPSSPPPKSAA